MELHKNTANAFVQYLIRHGYPKDRIVFEWGTSQCAVDIVVVADDLKTPVAAFEVKGRKTKQTVANGIMQMKRAAELLSLSVPMSLVLGLQQSPFFQIVDISDIVYRHEEVDVEEVLETDQSSAPLSYEAINAAALGKNLLKKAEEKKERMDHLGKVCWVLIPILVVWLLALDALRIYTLTSERLIVLGALLVVILLPFYSEFSIKDFSVKRNRDSMK